MIKIKEYLTEKQIEFLKKEIKKDQKVICYDCINKTDRKDYEYLFDTAPFDDCDFCEKSQFRTDVAFVPIVNLHKKYKELNHIDWCDKLPRIRETIINQVL